jgi:hypothetical protein
MTYDIFKDNDEKAQARESLPSLVKHSGWKFIIRALDANIAYLTDELKEKEFDDLLEVRLRQKRIVHLEELKALPDTIIEAAQPEIEDEEESIY